VAKRHPLWPPRRTSGVDDRRKRVTLEIGKRLRIDRHELFPGTASAGGDPQSTISATASQSSTMKARSATARRVLRSLITRP
jgi:hypothetical protein